MALSVPEVPRQRLPGAQLPSDDQLRKRAAARARRRSAVQARSQRQINQREYALALTVTDSALAAVAAVASYGLRFAGASQPYLAYIALTVAFPVAWVFALWAARAYEPRFFQVGTEELRRVTNAAVGIALASSVLSYALKLELARGFLLALSVLAPTFTIGGRWAMRRWLFRQRSAGGYLTRAVVVGPENYVAQVVDELHRTRGHGYDVVSICIAEDAPALAHKVPVRTGLDQAAALAEEMAADAVIVLPCHGLEPQALRELEWQLERSDTELYLAPGLLDVDRRRTTLAPVGTLPLLHVNHAEFRGARRYAKDVFDRVVAALALAVLSPLLLVVAVLIRLESPGPAIFRQERVGRDDSRFTMFKFRTMVTDAEQRWSELKGSNAYDRVMFKIPNDPRMTRLGRVLRRFSIDEIPQLVNVVLGDMSLVGPRPPLPREVELYERHVYRRLEVKPGLTGLWQVNGRSDLTWDEAVRLDLRYVDNWSLFLDVAILCRTFRAVVSGNGAY